MAWWTSKELHPKAKSKFVVVFGSQFFIPSVKTVGKPKIDFDTKEYKLLNHKFNYPGNGTWQPIDITFVDMNGLGSSDNTFDTSAFLWQVLNNTGYAYPYLDGGSNVSNNPYYNNVVDRASVSTGGHHIATKLSFRDDPRTQGLRERTSFRTITTPEKSSTIANSFGKGLDGNIDYDPAHYSKQKISIYQLSPEGNDEGKDTKIVECWHLVNPIVKSIGWGDLSYDSDDFVEYSMNIVYDWAIYDRKAIGTVFNVDAKPFQDFMKSYGLAQSSIDQEIQTQTQLENLKTTTLNDFEGIGSLQDYRDTPADPNADIQLIEKNFIDGNYDADGDGNISEAEMIYSQNNQEQINQILEKAESLKQEVEKVEAELKEADEFSEQVFREIEEAERREERERLDQALSNENIAESIDNLTDDFADVLKDEVQKLENIDKMNRDFIQQEKEFYETINELNDISRKADLQEQREQNIQNNPELLQRENFQYDIESEAGEADFKTGSLTNKKGYSTDLKVEKADRSRNDLADFEDDTQ